MSAGNPGQKVYVYAVFSSLKLFESRDNPGTTRRLTRGKRLYISSVFRGEHINFLARLNPGTTSRLSQGHLDVNQSKKFMFMCLFSPGETGTTCQTAEKKKAYTTTTERKSFGELFWPKRKTFQTGGGYKSPIKNQENHIHHRNLSSVAPIFFGKEKFCAGVGRCMQSFSQNWHFNRDRTSGMSPKWGFGLARLPVGTLCFYCRSFKGQHD